ncbi:MAG: hypothetical protein ABJN36_11615 [Cyclobacteriaceae bacterium]
MRQLLFILIVLTPLISFGQQPKLKEVTEYYPKTKMVKSHYFVIKPEKEIYHGGYEVYRKNGQLEERGYFDHGDKTSYIKFNSSGQVIKELSDSEQTTRTYFSNGELKSIEVTRNGEPTGTWTTYELNGCGKPFLTSAKEFQDGKVISKSESINHIFLGVSSVNTLITQDTFGKADTIHVNTTCDVIYPSEARRNQIEGTLFIKINLTADCDFNYELINELGYGIEDQFIDNLEQAKKKLKVNRNCQEIEVTIPMQFKLQ